MIENKFLHYKTIEDFENDLSKGDISENSIAFIQDINSIWSHGQHYECLNRGGGGNLVTLNGKQTITGSKTITGINNYIYSNGSPNIIVKRGSEQNPFIRFNSIKEDEREEICGEFGFNPTTKKPMYWNFTDKAWKDILTDDIQDISWKNRQKSEYQINTKGWYRCYSTDGSIVKGQNILLSISRTYNNNAGETYMFSISIANNALSGDELTPVITQLSGKSYVKLIPKIRVLLSHNKIAYIDFYYDSEYANQVNINAVGEGKVSTPPELVGEILEGYKSVEFNTVNGFKSSEELYKDSDKVSVYTNFPGFQDLISQGYLDQSYSSSYPTEKYYEALIKWVVGNYPRSGNALILQGITKPSSQCFCTLCLYNTNDIQEGLPRYSYGYYVRYDGDVCVFGTSGYNYRYDYALYRGTVIVKPINDVDLNTIPASNFNVYSAPIGNTCTNLPESDIKAFTLQVTSFIMTLTDIDGRVYTRSYISGKWGKWSKILTEQL